MNRRNESKRKNIINKSIENISKLDKMMKRVSRKSTDDGIKVQLINTIDWPLPVNVSGQKNRKKSKKSKKSKNTNKSSRSKKTKEKPFEMPTIEMPKIEMPTIEIPVVSKKNSLFVL